MVTSARALGGWVVVASAAALGCGSSSTHPGGASGGAGGSAPIAGPTYYADVAPITMTKCAGCHQPGTFAPFALTTYEDVSAVSGLVAQATKTGLMPPWGALETAECSPPNHWKGDLRLAPEEIATLEAWHEAGAPMGDPKDAPEGLAPADGYFELADADFELTPKAPYVVSGESDVFRCFVIDLDTSEDVFMNAIQVVPGNPEVVHHSVIVIDPTGDSAALADADGGFDCFGGAGVASGGTLDVWVPGSAPREFPPNVGTRLPAGATMVMQIHYHPLGPAAAPDLTRIQIRTNKTLPEFELFTVLMGNASEPPKLLPGPNDEGGVAFHIPAGAKDHVESMRFDVSADEDAQVPIYGVFTHMHYVGTDMRVVVEHDDGSSECFLQTPKWDFNWQRFYAYDAPIAELPKIRFGDEVSLRCQYDNSWDNPFVQRALKEQGLAAPVDVVLGEETLNEMCVVGFQALLPL